MAPEVGTRVQATVTTLAGAIEHVGRLLPPAEAGSITIKLENGYNVSYPESDVILAPLPVESQEEAPSRMQPTSNPESPHLRILHTGGTIACKVDYRSGAVLPSIEPEELLASVPELAGMANISVERVSNMFSDDMRPVHWNRMAEASRTAFEDGASAVIITHGTDSLHLSAASMAFAWALDGGRPPGWIVFVGSQRSADRGSSDATENLVAAVQWAIDAPPPTGSLGDATVVVMHSTSDDGECVVLPGPSCRKMHSSRRDAFQAINAQPIGHVRGPPGAMQIELEPWYARAREATPLRPTTLHPRLVDASLKVARLVGDAFLQPNLVAAAVELSDAVVIAGSGLGHLPIFDPEQDAPENIEVERVLRDAIEAGTPVVLTLQTVRGPIDLDVYAKGRRLREIGILGHDTSFAPETAVIRLLHLMSGTSTTWRDRWSEDLIGEHHPRL